MSRTALPIRKLVKMSEDDAVKLTAVAAELSLDESAAIRMCVAEKYRALGLGAAPPAKKKRRARAAS